jgi:hypothetical protein
MTRWAAATGVAIMLAAFPAAAQSTPAVQVLGPASNPVTDAYATFTISTANFAAADLPLRLNLQVATTADFDSPLFADTTVDGSSATITIPRLLPGSGLLFWRAFALTARAGSVPSAVTGPRVAPTHLRLVSPNNAAGQSLDARRPTFIWRASQVPLSIGHWEFELRIDETATGRPHLPIVSTNDTVVTFPEPLEANASYRWTVKGRVRATGDSVSASSLGTFVILSDESPFTTLLQNPFPSPFPLGSVSSVCIWFDLSTPGNVTLEIVDIRGLLVRRLIPGSASSSTVFAPGRYGRPSPGATSGCDDRFSWDGTDARGRPVPPGAYLIRLRAAGRDFKARVVFNGR